MHNFHNILYVSNAIGSETEGLKQALSLARNNRAPLTVLVVCPELPESLGDYKKSFVDSLLELVKKSIQSTREVLKLGKGETHVTITVESGDTPATRIVRHVLRDAYDLVIKEAEPEESGRGFMALDMQLLRQCPCPVWLCRPIAHHRNEIRVAVAIDPESSEQVGRDLSVKLLQLSRSLADTCSGELSIISCWFHKFEDYSHQNVWMKISGDERRNILAEMKANHLTSLEEIIRKSNIAGQIRVHHIKGRPDQMIPSFLESEKVDILVLGTVARTGIRSFIMGNTAENVVQKLDCSLLALKPNGFISPVEAY